MLQVRGCPVGSATATHSADSMNISGALSIQTATVGGKGSGSYVDSDKFKESDINFHLQVKVVNQIQKSEPYTLFNKIHTVQPKDFTAVYGVLGLLHRVWNVC